jgi:hypothetical protein
MRSLLICLLIANIAAAQQYDVVISNGKIIDGTAIAGITAMLQ